jgi:hypothetical protein
MGLEFVELVMDCEDEFGISIPDAAVGKVRTVGEFFDLILALIRSSGKPELRQRPDLEQYSWDRVRYFCIRPQKDFEFITRSTRFIEDLGYG